MSFVKKFALIITGIAAALATLYLLSGMRFSFTLPGSEDTGFGMWSVSRPLDENNAPKSAEDLTGLWRAIKYLQLDDEQKNIIMEGDFSGDPQYLGFGENGICFDVYKGADGSFICRRYLPYGLKGSRLNLGQAEENIPQGGFSVYRRDEFLEAFIVGEGEAGMTFEKVADSAPAVSPEGDYPETVRGPQGQQVLFDRSTLIGLWRGSQQIKLDPNTRIPISTNDFKSGDFPPHLSFGEKGLCFDVSGKDEKLFCRKYYPFYISGFNIYLNYNIISPAESISTFGLEWKSGKLEMTPHRAEVRFVLEKISSDPLSEITAAESGTSAPFPYCGDGICSYNEDTFVCPSDCGGQ